MNTLDLKKLLLCSSLLVSGFAFNNVAYAQEDVVEDEVIETTPVADEEEEGGDNIIVTGSRIKRDTFSSLSPLQVITSDTEIKAGLLDTSAILQNDESAAGTQIDATFNGFVLDNGPGSSTVNLRGLGSNRTLVMLNGRRLGPAGVEGAPTAPSINSIPTSLVERYDLLLDGASSVYGSDAVAGVVNVILKKDFDGFEVFAQGDYTEQGNNSDYTVSGTWGANNDRGFIGFGAEYDYIDEVKLKDRDFLAGCDRHVEIDENGNIRNESAADDILFQEWFGGFRGAPEDRTDCKIGGGVGVASSFGQGGGFANNGVIYHADTDTFTNIGIPGFVDQTFLGVPIDGDGDGVQDFGFANFSRNGLPEINEQTFFREQKRVSLMAYGEYTLEGAGNLTPYFEVLFTNTKTASDNGAPQLFPDVSATNPFNPCGINGVDCNATTASFIGDPAFRQRFNTFQRDRDPNRDGDNRDARICATLGVPQDPDGTYRFDLATGFFDNANCNPEAFGAGFGQGPVPAFSLVSVRGDRSESRTSIDKIDGAVGVKGDLPFMSFGSLNNWSFEASLKFSRSNGFSVIDGIRDDRLNFALGNDIASGTPVNFRAPCTAGAGEVVSPDVANGCVPVNLFARSLGTEVIGDFATQAERDYLFDTRRFDTTYTQFVWNAYASGNLMELPAGNLAMVVGAEYRIDDLDSDPNNVASEGLLFGFTSDGGAAGKKATRELFGELDIPIVADKTFFRQVDLNVSGRVTDDEFYGTNYTYALKGGWRPIDSLTLKGSFGTSFRAPNLRENFLRTQTGFNNVFDPCVVPVGAFQSIGGLPAVYNPNNDNRDADVIARCQREGLDPFSLGQGQNNGVTNIEIGTTGTFDLNPERSNAMTLGFAFEQPFYDSFDFNLGLSYYRIEVNDSIIEPSAQFSINDCFSNSRPVAARGAFCDNIVRGADGLIDFVDGGFSNRDTDLVRGMDINARFDYDFAAFDRAMDFTLIGRANHLLNRSVIDVDDDGNASLGSFHGEFGFPTWTGRVDANLAIDDKWDIFWRTRFISSVAQDEENRDEFANVFGVDTDGDGIVDFTSDTCGGAVTGDVNCRDVGFADAYFVHTASIGYKAETWDVTVGVSNVFNTSPPEVDGSEVFAISNTPVGNGYDLDGRRFFVNARKKF